MKMDYELQSKKKEVCGEIGYGIMWLFVALLIVSITYSKGFEGIFHYIVAIPASIASIYKFYKGVTQHNKMGK